MPRPVRAQASYKPKKVFYIFEIVEKSRCACARRFVRFTDKKLMFEVRFWAEELPVLRGAFGSPTRTGAKLIVGRFTWSANATIRLAVATQPVYRQGRYVVKTDQRSRSLDDCSARQERSFVGAPRKCRMWPPIQVARTGNDVRFVRPDQSWFGVGGSSVA